LLLCPVGEVALSQAESRLRSGGTRPQNPKPEQARSPSPNQSPTGHGPQSPSPRRSPMCFRPQSPSPRGSPICFGPQSPSPRRSSCFFLLQSPSPRRSPICFGPPEPESKGESDLLWTPESNGLQIQIQNQMDSVHFLVTRTRRILIRAPPTTCAGIAAQPPFPQTH
jgi:hypothetical protein